MEAVEPSSATDRKLGESILDEEKNTRDGDEGVRNGYVLFDTLILVILLEEIGKCILCNSPITDKHKIHLGGGWVLKDENIDIFKNSPI